MKNNDTATRFQALHYYRSAGESGVTAKRNLGGGSEPTQTIVFAFLYKKSCFTQVVLRCNSLKQASSGNLSINITAAGFPANLRVVKASR